MKFKVVFQQAAWREFDEAADWYEAQREGLGGEIESEVDLALLRACENPQLYTLLHGNTRRVRLHRFPYSIFFQVHGRRLVVLSVFHNHRNPSQWQRRI